MNPLLNRRTNGAVSLSRVGGSYQPDPRLAVHQKGTGHGPLAGHIDDGLPAHSAVESELPGRIEEAEGGVARPGVRPARPEVEHGSTRT